MQESDIPAIRAMTAAAVEIDRSEGPATEARLTQILQMLGEKIETNTLACLTADEELAAIAFVFTRPGEDEFSAMFDGMVHVDHRGQGLGSHILDWVEGRAREEYEASAQERPLVLHTSCADHLADRIDLFTGHGFKAARYAYKMERDLTLPIPEEPLPAGLDLRVWTEAYDQTLMEAFNVAFHGQWGVPQMDEVLWRQLFTGVPQFKGDSTYLAMDGESIAGFCINWIDQTKNEERGVREGWIEAVGVIPEWRGKGLASALLSQSLRNFFAAGMERAALDVDTQNPTGALRLYEKLGFEAAKRTIHFTKEVDSAD